MATTTNYGWETPDDTDLVKDGASAIRTLGSSIDTTTKALNPETTLGDISYRSSTSNTNTRLAIGTSGQVLTVSSGVPAWTTISSGGLTLISETVANANSSISLSSIPSTYKQIMLIWSGIKHSNVGSQFTLRANNSTTTILSYRNIRGVDNTVTTQEGGHTYVGGNSPYVFGENIASVISGYEYRAGEGCIVIDDYTSTSKYKSVQFRYGWRNDTSGANTFVTGLGWLETLSAISSLDIVRLTGSETLTNVTNTSIRLYGVS